MRAYFKYHHYLQLNQIILLLSYIKKKARVVTAQNAWLMSSALMYDTVLLSALEVGLWLLSVWWEHRFMVCYCSEAEQLQLNECNLNEGKK